MISFISTIISYFFPSSSFFSTSSPHLHLLFHLFHITHQLNFFIAILIFRSFSSSSSILIIFFFIPIVCFLFFLFYIIIIVIIIIFFIILLKLALNQIVLHKKYILIKKMIRQMNFKLDN